MSSGGGSSSSITLYTDAACTQAATAQQVIDAFSAGSVRISAVSGSNEIMMTVVSILHSTVSTQTEGGGTSPTAVLIFVSPAAGSIQQLGLME